jgi:YgiT-type zinc finger domain-containing protein
MKCFMCKGSLINKLTTFMVDIDSCIIIVKNVPSQVCSQCGEASYSNEVTKQLEKIVNSLRKSITEIAVVNYTDNAA